MICYCYDKQLWKVLKNVGIKRRLCEVKMNMRNLILKYLMFYFIEYNDVDVYFELFRF